MLLGPLLLLPLVNASPLSEAVSSKIKALQQFVATHKFGNSSFAPGQKDNGRFYPEAGPLTFRELMAKEAFRFVAQMALDRMPARRHDDSYEVYYTPHKKKKLHARQFFESEEFILFLVGLGIASVLGMATMMAPLNAMYSNAAYAGGGFVPAGPAMLAQGRKRRSINEADYLDGVSRTVERAMRRFAKSERRHSFHVP